MKHIIPTYTDLLILLDHVSKLLNESSYSTSSFSSFTVLVYYKTSSYSLFKSSTSSSTSDS